MTAGKSLPEWKDFFLITCTSEAALLFAENFCMLKMKCEELVINVKVEIALTEEFFRRQMYWNVCKGG